MLAAAGAVALAFAATPFQVPEIAAELDVRLGTAGLLSAFQVGGFAATTFVAGRLLRPQASIHKVGLVTTGMVHLLCVVAPEFWMVLVLQLLAGEFEESASDVRFGGSGYGAVARVVPGRGGRIGVRRPPGAGTNRLFIAPRRRVRFWTAVV